jgi:hypothetical protein
MQPNTGRTSPVENRLSAGDLPVRDRQNIAACAFQQPRGIAETQS